MKGPTEKHFEGIYANPRLMHSVGQIVGCVVQVQVKNGSIFEGVLRTFSSKADFVLELAQRVDKNSNNPSTVINSNNPDDYFEKIVFSFGDVIMISACNVDPDFATRETFTDTAISKFNGQVLEKELEPWDGETSTGDGLLDLGTGEEEANGWDPQDMFKTNEEKYGVKSSFDKTLSGYTIPLNKQNTEEYRQKEEKADKVATEIESSMHHKTRAALENGDEEERFSAVVRPENMNNFRFVPHRQRRSAQNIRNMRNNGTSHMNRNSHQHTQVFPRVSSPTTATNSNNSQAGYRQVNSSNSISPRQTPASSPRQSNVPGNNSTPQFQQTSTPSPVNPSTRTTPPSVTTPTSSQEESHKLNGESDKTDLKFAPKPPRSLNLHSSANKEMRETIINQQVSNKNMDRRKELDKKTAGQKARDEKTEDLKRFHAKFKLSEDPKDTLDSVQKPDVHPATSSAHPAKHHHKERQKEEERRTPDNRKTPESPKNFTLNPNAKEFVFNPNAKSFTPRGVPIQAVVPPPVQPPPRLHSQSPIMAMPQPHLMPGMAQPMFNVAPHYVVSATPVSMAPPFTPAPSVAQAPRFRKAMPMTLRHDLSQPVHVQAATGQPILAQPTLSGPQFTIQYATPPGMLHPPGPPQQLAYAQMYSLMPRVLTPQPVGMVPTSAAYGESPQIPTHVYMSHPAGPGLQHAMTSGNGGQHSTPSTPQSQTPNIHPAPSPVHQPPPSGGHGQPPTPTGHPSNAPTPQPVMYSHGHVAAHPLHPNHQSSNQGHPFAASYPGTPQPIVLLQQQPHTFTSSLQNHLHGQTAGNHAGTPTHVLQHTPLAMIPTSAGMVHSQTHYVPHSQV
ncbi:ataxin-2-like protein isoform X2 [Parasteatoda tepidariorum]|uniref:ataxin-2-like protein isoform X2 n=1 Tax=Parasteatoda tepidariorum TaxID=114398 RepID=UPI001C72304B|nr:ataxin-2-like protein isoform X2 [Parasteatoda tepidariorum]